MEVKSGSDERETRPCTVHYRSHYSSVLADTQTHRHGEDRQKESRKKGRKKHRNAKRKTERRQIGQINTDKSETEVREGGRERETGREREAGREWEIWRERGREGQGERDSTAECVTDQKAPSCPFPRQNRYH